MNSHGSTKLFLIIVAFLGTIAIIIYFNNQVMSEISAVTKDSPTPIISGLDGDKNIVHQRKKIVPADLPVELRAFSENKPSVIQEEAPQPKKKLSSQPVYEAPMETDMLLQ